MRPSFRSQHTRLISSCFALAPTTRSLHASRTHFQEASKSNAHRNFYKTHGRALFKTLTLAFFSYQCFYWIWLTFETETEKDLKNREVKSLEGEVRLLEEGRKSHSPGGLGKLEMPGRNLLDEQKRA